MVLTFESLDGILKSDHSNESYWAVLSCGTGVVHYAVRGGSYCWPLYKVVQTFESDDEIVKCDPSSESYWEVLSSGVEYFNKCEKPLA